MAENSMNMTDGLDLKKLRPGQCVISRMADQKVVAVSFTGDPNKITSIVTAPLYASAYGVRNEYKANGNVFAVEKMRGRWSDSNLGKDKSLWVGEYALPVPGNTMAIPPIKKDKQVDGLNIELKVWRYGDVAQVMYVGSYEEEHATIQEMHWFAESKGYRVIPNSHEEIYVSDPRKTQPSQMKTILLCRLEKR